MITVTQKKYVRKPSGIVTVCFDFEKRGEFLFRVIQNIEDARFHAKALMKKGYQIEFKESQEYAQKLPK
jgi:hypothetical protein